MMLTLTTQMLLETCDDLPMDSSPEFIELAELIMTEEVLRMQENANEARNLYLTLVNEIEKLM